MFSEKKVAYENFCSMICKLPNNIGFVKMMVAIIGRITNLPRMLENSVYCSRMNLNAQRNVLVSLLIKYCEHYSIPTDWKYRVECSNCVFVMKGFNDIFSAVVARSTYFRNNKINIFREAPLPASKKRYDFLFCLGEKFVGVEIDDSSHLSALASDNDNYKSEISKKFDIHLVKINFKFVRKGKKYYNLIMMKIWLALLEIRNVFQNV
jgi:hypothetical protein